ncbi:Na+/H+ antiporter [Lentibacillus kapialis]|uniref:Na+/H+ antiporter n=1 Tax=Lentibacillus kapialis TaxID=340214 RepID=A0A917PJD8_9BACI|nr:cation:proton antiporter [Lentibacillus kapialis]GGJ81747.1 Na+/H+ antiporter [Lentibacillus kapialis]
MEEFDLHHIFSLILILLMIAAGITAIAKKFGRPYPIALVIVGAAIGLVNIPVLEALKDFITEGEIFNFAVVTLFLPALLGEAALKLPFSQLSDNKKPILLLAFAGTFLSFIIIGFSSLWLLQLSVPAAFVFAAVMSATDPVSVLSIFKNIGVHKRLSTIIEGESLFNDGLAVVLFNISAFSLLTYAGLGIEGAGLGAWEFIKVVALGLITGGACGYIISRITRYFDDYPLEIIFSIILFYGAYLLAEQLDASGVIAVVVSALILGNYGSKIGMSPTTKLNISNFWDVATLLANSLVFLMVGLEITRIDVAGRWGLIVMAILIILIARSAAVYMSTLFAGNLPVAWKHILNWGGLKGSLSIALVLSLPRNFAGREDILILTFSVVLFSLVCQGLTIKPFLKWLGVIKQEDGYREYESLLAQAYRHENAIQEVNRVKQDLHITDTVTHDILADYQQNLEEIQEQIEQLFQEHPELKAKQQNTLRKHSLYAQHAAVERLVKEDIISGDVADDVIEDIMNQLSELESEY